MEKGYRHRRPLEWYTSSSSLYSILNGALREMNVSILLKIGFFIRDLYENIEGLCEEQQSNPRIAKTAASDVYRGQGLVPYAFEKMRKGEVKLKSFNNFLSTSVKRDVATMFAESATGDPNLVGVPM
ncbi:unnamed protein product [Rotaria sp. Silwood2]|nr:unnamed protein product [Rotaria sp. Silwood2]CAF3196684.1 unnamed protein product [Rotaria sp. Silwood2]CAF4560147.1 unnamed protein product [Rotaria sp. Silwood2]CAF4568070.1 unnamed protein product [Rotaria sp. Silwood2]